ncbi:MAG: DUF4437 domain-containing protein [Planctomycetota bacterium]|nr:DUF4437 domain-containing protein [Planctomycetota bacterium]
MKTLPALYSPFSAKQNTEHVLQYSKHHANTIRIATIMKLNTLLIFATTLTACASSQDTSARARSDIKVVLASQVNWEKLNPARGDKSPQAATLWGDRNGTDATGFLFKPIDGFQSPPHIHNVSYRGIVLRGVVHNDDPKAEKMWMPAGSFWTQPAGEVHITAAKGTNTLAYIEIEQGPYLVRPTEKAFDNGERPVNIDQSNIVWLDALADTSAEQNVGVNSNNNPKIAFLWGKPQANQMNGTLIKLPKGFTGEIHSNAPIIRAVVIAGELQHRGFEDSTVKTLDPGSYFYSTTNSSAQRISVSTTKESTLYMRSTGKTRVVVKASKQE